MLGWSGTVSESKAALHIWSTEQLLCRMNSDSSLASDVHTNYAAYIVVGTLTALSTHRSHQKVYTAASQSSQFHCVRHWGTAVLQFLRSCLIIVGNACQMTKCTPAPVAALKSEHPAKHTVSLANLDMRGELRPEAKEESCTLSNMHFIHAKLQTKYLYYFVQKQGYYQTSQTGSYYITWQEDVFSASVQPCHNKSVHMTETVFHLKQSCSPLQSSEHVEECLPGMEQLSRASKT